MSHSRSRTTALVVTLILLLLVLLLLLGRCSKKPQAEPNKPVATNASAAQPTPGSARPSAPDTPEDLSPATLSAPKTVAAGSAFQVAWTGPNNANDYITLAVPASPADRNVTYQTVTKEKVVHVTAPMDPGVYQLRYIASRSHTVLGTAEIEVTPVEATVSAPAEATAGAPVKIDWTGPNNAGDYITIVPKTYPDSRYGNNTEVRLGSPLTVTAPIEPGEAEIRYKSGQGQRVLARRDIKIVGARVTLSAPAEVIAGSEVQIEWTGPKNAGDYITIVPKSLPEGQYGNNTEVRHGSPLKVTAPIEPNACEIRYIAGQGSRVLGRRDIAVRAASITLSATDEVVAGSEVIVTWTGPSNAGDYITIVPKATPDGRYGNNSETRRGSPLDITAPIDAGDAEIRYMSGQGSKVLARRALSIKEPKIEIDAPASAPAGSMVSVTWKGPSNRGDYFTIVPADAKQGTYRYSTYTTRGSPLEVKALETAGPAEIRYISGQGSRILGSRRIEVRP
jgi:uncharacterized OB-fold protein